MSRKWLIGTVFFIVVLEAWTMTLVTAQYQCNNPSNVCQQANVTQCTGACAVSNCESGMNKTYQGTAVNVSSTPGPCATVTDKKVDCYLSYECLELEDDNQACVMRDGGMYCKTGFPSTRCTYCWPAQMGDQNYVATQTCSNCGG